MSRVCSGSPRRELALLEAQQPAPHNWPICCGVQCNTALLPACLCAAPPSAVHWERLMGRCTRPRRQREMWSIGSGARAEQANQPIGLVAPARVRSLASASIPILPFTAGLRPSKQRSRKSEKVPSRRRRDVTCTSRAHHVPRLAAPGARGIARHAACVTRHAECGVTQRVTGW